MRQLVFASLLVALSALPVSAQEDFVWALEQEVEFLGFHDPGYLELKDAAGKQSELDFGYRGLPYAVVEKWPAGKKILLAYSPERGTEVIDPESGERYPIRAARPRIDELQARCLEQRMTTLGMSECYSEATAAWDVELNRAYQHVMKSGLSDESKAAIRTAQREWIEFRDATMAAIAAVGIEKGGTIRTLETGSAALALTKDQTLTLQRYLDR